MFVQVIEGRARDAGEVLQLLDDWVAQQGPKASGWLGSTAGVADDGTFVTVARFEDAASARSNSDRPEQGEWWSRLVSALDGEPTVRDCSQVEVMGQGGSDDAGFVQVMVGHSSDLERLSELGRSFGEAMQERRPDVIGALVGAHDDDPGGFTQVIYFTDEASAREGERQSSDAEPGELDNEFRQLITDIRYIDLRSPQMVSPA